MPARHRATPTAVGRWHGQGDADLPVAAHSLQLLAAAGAGVTLKP